MLTSRALALAVVALAALGALGGCSDDESGSAEELCRALGGGTAFQDQFEGFDPTDVDAALTQLRDGRVQLGELRDAAPGEVRSDIEMQIDYVQDLIEALEQVDPLEPAAAVAAMQRTADEHPDQQQAADRLEAWTETTC